jgi:methylated-DNA-[protein]-cysteine S-methyltransferase
MSLARRLSSPIGPIRVVVDGGAVRQIDLHWERSTAAQDLQSEQNQQGDEAVMERVAQALRGYFQQAVALQEIPHQPLGTPFQRRVWAALEEIALGEVVTYGELARVLQSSPRAVAGACRHNPLPLITPCHRVIARSGIGGFSGQWGEGERVDAKRWLLRHEGVSGGAVFDPS